MVLNASYKDIWRVAYPIIIGSLAQNLIGLTDIMFLGRVGEVELGASGLVSIYYIVLVMVGFGISRGGQILIARRAGQGKYQEIGSITYNLLYIEMFVASLLFLFLLFLSPTVLKFFINYNDIYEASLAYLDYRMYSIPFSFLGFVVMALYIGIGRTRVIATITIILLLVNVCFNYSLIFGKFGMPEMGIAGAGLASTIAEIVSTLAGIIYILNDKEVAKFNLFKFYPLRKDTLNSISQLSTPIVFQYIVGLGGWFILFSLIESMGKRALAISTVIKNIYTFYSIPAWGFGSAINSIVSNIIGQQKHNEALIAMKRTTVLSFTSTAIACLSLVIFYDYILHIFTNDLEVIAGAKPLLYVLLLIILAASISVVIFNGLMGTGATLFSLLAETIGVVIYLTYAFAVVKIMNLDLSYVWTSEFLYWLMLAISAGLYLYSGRWRKLKV